jgi:hypothetical protein
MSKTYTKMVKGKRVINKDIYWDYQLPTLAKLFDSLLGEFNFVKREDVYYIENGTTRVKVDFTLGSKDFNLRICYYDANRDMYEIVDNFHIYMKPKFGVSVVYCFINKESRSSDIYSICDNIMGSIRKGWDLSLGE